jgi:uncharacterized protein with PIN domain
MPELWLLDEMLTRLGRLMRAAGHDVVLAPPRAPDAELVARAAAEDRILVSRDRELILAAGARGLRLEADNVDDQAAELTRKTGLSWTLAPFTRCSQDNAPLRPATAPEIAAMPGDTGQLPGPFKACPACGRLYWPGSHVRRLRAKLAALEAMRLPKPSP